VALLIISIPLMLLAVGLAVIPLIVVSHRDHQRHRADAHTTTNADNAAEFTAPGVDQAEVPVAA
jgi:hypothetical protein